MDDHDGLCPECNGDGLDLAVDIPEGWYFDQSFAEVIDCIACAGTGTLTAIPSEEEEAQSAYQAIGGTLHTERHEGRDVLTLPWPIRPR